MALPVLDMALPLPMPYPSQDSRQSSSPMYVPTVDNNLGHTTIECTDHELPGPRHFPPRGEMHWARLDFSPLQSTTRLAATLSFARHLQSLWLPRVLCYH